jgi:hypothetical protein
LPFRRNASSGLSARSGSATSLASSRCLGLIRGFRRGALLRSSGCLAGSAAGGEPTRSACVTAGPREARGYPDRAHAADPPRGSWHGCVGNGQ